jgi:hypothetical protein
VNASTSSDARLGSTKLRHGSLLSAHALAGSKKASPEGTPPFTNIQTVIPAKAGIQFFCNAPE